MRFPAFEAVARRTPLVEVSDPSRSRLLLKCENLQLGGAFKIRGAFNTIARLTTDERARGVINYSSGNHGRAVALAANRLGAPAVIVMPASAPQIKVDGVREVGGELIFEGTTSVERQVRAESEAAKRGLTMVPPVRSPLDYRRAGNGRHRDSDGLPGGLRALGAQWRGLS